MKKLTKIQILALSFVLCFISCTKPQKEFILDYQTAKTRAQKKNTDLILFFTGFDWNEQSTVLFNSLFNSEGFFTTLSKKYVLCNINLDKEESSNLLKQQILNYQLVTDYNVQSLPWVVLETPEGDVYGFSAIDAESATVHSLARLFDSFVDTRTQIIELRKKIKKSNGIEKAEAIDAFLTYIEPTRREHYQDLIRLVPELDPENTAIAADKTRGLKGKYMLQTAYLDAIILYQKEDFFEAGNQFFNLLETAPLTGPQKQEALYMGAYIHAVSNIINETETIKWLEKAFEANPASEGANFILSTINQIRTNIENNGNN